MTNNKYFSELTSLENSIDYSFSIFSNFLILARKRILLKNIEKIHESLPNELRTKRNFLDSLERTNTFKLLNQLYSIINNSKSFLGFVILNKSQIINIIDNLYAILPTDLQEISN